MIGSKPDFLGYREIGSTTIIHRCAPDKIIRGLKEHGEVE
jgi:hypothetical protein